MITRWHAHLRDLATEIHEISGLGRIIHGALFEGCEAVIVDAEGSTNECGVVLRCKDEKGGFASLTEGQP